MTNDEKLTLAHGSGGQLTHELVERLLLPRFDNPALRPLADSALLPGGLAFTTDSFVVSPLFFPGGDIGKLAVCGTVNDLAVAGARPEWISCGLIIEEGFGERSGPKAHRGGHGALGMCSARHGHVVIGRGKIGERLGCFQQLGLDA